MGGNLEQALARVAAKVHAGERLDREDGLALFRSSDLLAVGQLADEVRRRKGGDRVYFLVNRHINPTNVCENLCPLCAFGLARGKPGTYTMSLDEVEAKARASRELGISEIHMVAGLSPELDLAWYEEALRRIKVQLPQVVIQAFTAVEVDYLAALAGLSLEDTLRRLRSAGLDSLPGGGAEVFASRVRRKICPKKISGERWLQVHETAHRLGLPTNATMLYGHIETHEERVEHLLALRELQDRTGGFLTFIPLAFHPAHTRLGDDTLGRGPTGMDDLKTIAVARLLLDNFPHVKAMWIQIGLKLAQVALSFGADDLDGTVMEEQIYHAAGAATDQHTPRETLVRLIREAGRLPVERDTLYRVLAEVS